MAERKKLTVAALIPMRHSSQRVKGKNFRPLHGKPLFHYVLETLLSCKQIDKIVIDTDSPDIIDDCKKNFPSVILLLRPDHLRAADTPMNDVLLNDIAQVEADLYMQTHSTNPLLTVETVSKAIDQFLAIYPQRDSLFTVKRHQTRLWSQLITPINHNPNILLQTQDLPPVYEENSCLYIFSKDTLSSYHNRIGMRPLMIEMSHEESVDIDTEWDWRVAEMLVAEKYKIPLCPVDAVVPSEQKKILKHIKPVPEYKYEKKYTVLVSAPYMIMNLKRFQPILESFALDLLIPNVNERLTEEEIFGLAGKFDGGICGDDKFSPEAIKKCAPRLKVLSKWGTGVDSFDPDAAKEHGVQICRTPDAFSIPVSESVLGYMLSFARKQPWMTSAIQKEGEWKKIPGITLSECTVGVIGVGNVGKAVLRRAKPFAKRLIGCDVAPVDPNFVRETGVELVSLEQLLREADFISVNTDLNPTSFHIINKDTLAQMKPNAVVINTARGPCVDEPALVEALKSGQIAGAGLDVFEKEPLPADSPLRSLSCVQLAPHNSNSSPLYWELVHWNTIRNLLVALNIPFVEEEVPY